MTQFTFAYGCLVAMALLPYLCVAMAKWHGFGKRRKDGGYDNADPRIWLANQTGFSARANAAQANTFEALPFFFAAVIIAHQMGALQSRLDILCAVFVVLRLIYVLLYVAGMGSFRSAIWFAALLVNLGVLALVYK